MEEPKVQENFILSWVFKPWEDRIGKSLAKTELLTRLRLVKEGDLTSKDYHPLRITTL